MNRTEAAASKASHGAAQRWNEIAEWATTNSSDIALAVAIGLVIAGFLYLLRRVGHRLIRERDPNIRWQTIFGRVLAKTSLFFIIACAAKLV